MEHPSFDATEGLTQRGELGIPSVPLGRPNPVLPLLACRLKGESAITSRHGRPNFVEREGFSCQPATSYCRDERLQ